jgi:hypothetical protein
MKLDNFKLIKEEEDSYHIESPKGHSFKVAKDKLHPKAHEAIRLLAEGGQITPNLAPMPVAAPAPMIAPSSNQPDLQGMMAMPLPAQQSVGTPASTNPGLAELHKSPEELMAMATDYAHNIGGVGGTTAEVAAPLVEAALPKALRGASPAIQQGYKDLLQMAEKHVLDLHGKVGELLPNHQGLAQNLSKQGLEALKEHISNPKMIDQLLRLEPEGAIAKMMSNPELKTFKQALYKYGNAAKSDLHKYAEGGEAESEFNMPDPGIIEQPEKFREFVRMQEAQAQGMEPVAQPVGGMSLPPELAPSQPQQQIPLESNVAPSVIPSQAPMQAMPDPFAAEKAAQLKRANMISNQAKAEAGILGGLDSKLAALPTQEDIIKKHADSEAAAFKAYQNAKIDPNHLYHNSSTSNKIVAGIGLLLSGIGAGLSGQPNMALKVMNDAIDRDIDAQKTDKASKQNLWRMNRERLGDDLSANLVTKNQLMMGAKYKLMQAASQFKGPQAQAEAAFANAQIDKEAAKNRAILAAMSKTTESTGGQDPRSEAGHTNWLNTLQQLQNQGVAAVAPIIKEAEAKLLPGIGTTKIVPTDKDREALANNSATKAALSELQALATQGPTLPGSKADSVNKTKMAALQLQMKNSYQLGVLSETDYKMLDRLVSDPGALWTGKSLENLEATKKSVDQKTESVYNKLGVTPFSKSQQSPQVTEALKWVKANPNDPRAASILQKLGIK